MWDGHFSSASSRVMEMHVGKGIAQKLATIFIIAWELGCAAIRQPFVAFSKSRLVPPICGRSLAPLISLSVCSYPVRDYSISLGGPGKTCFMKEY